MTTPQDDKTSELIGEHATAIGLLCIYSASLDQAICHLIERMLASDVKTVACLLEATPDISQRAGTAQRLAFSLSPTDDWRDCIVGMMNLVSNGIAPRRNRFVHDDWRVTTEAIIRIDRRVKINKTQAFMPLAISHVSEREVDVASIHALIEKICDVMVHITFLGLALDRWRRDGTPPEPNDKAIELSKFQFPEATGH